MPSLATEKSGLLSSYFGLIGLTNPLFSELFLLYLIDPWSVFIYVAFRAHLLSNFYKKEIFYNVR